MDDATIEVLGRVRLGLFHARINRMPHRVAAGAWAVYVPARQLKLLHSVGGLVHCSYHRAPKREAVLTGQPINERHATLAEWQAVLSKPVTRRVAENYVCLQRLFAAGLGPEPLGLVIVPDYKAWFSRGHTFTAGYRVANLMHYPEKEPATEQQLRDAGVIPDGSLSAVREQIRGYVSDLNSVRGAMPDGGEAEVAAIEAQLNAALMGAGISLPTTH